LIPPPTDEPPIDLGFDLQLFRHVGPTGVKCRHVVDPVDQAADDAAGLLRGQDDPHLLVRPQFGTDGDLTSTPQQQPVVNLTQVLTGENLRLTRHGLAGGVGGD